LELGARLELGLGSVDLRLGCCRFFVKRSTLSSAANGLVRVWVRVRVHALLRGKRPGEGEGEG